MGYVFPSLPRSARGPLHLHSLTRSTRGYWLSALSTACSLSQEQCDRTCTEHEVYRTFRNDYTRVFIHQHCVRTCRRNYSYRTCTFRWEGYVALLHRTVCETKHVGRSVSHSVEFVRETKHRWNSFGRPSIGGIRSGDQASVEFVRETKHQWNSFGRPSIS
jgi:hypothetical protein